MRECRAVERFGDRHARQVRVAAQTIFDLRLISGKPLGVDDTDPQPRGEARPIAVGIFELLGDPLKSLSAIGSEHPLLFQFARPQQLIVPEDVALGVLAFLQEQIHQAQGFRGFRVVPHVDRNSDLALEIAQDALEATIPSIKIGMTEKELSSELVVQLLRCGSEPEMPFAPIVSGGPNSANPHASPSERKLQAGDLLVVDWGATYDGYISDLTRTFAVGDVDDEYKKIHQIVQSANAAGRAAGKPGVPCAAVDKAARDVIEAAGYGVYFTHRTGHGLGLEGHEPPYIVEGNNVPLETGNTFTIEPGIYVPGLGGVRIEDDVLITENGAESLTTFDRELRVLG